MKQRRSPTLLTHKDLMLATPIAKPFSAPGWLFELKYDGFRILASKHEDDVRLITRNGDDLAAVFPEVAAAMRRLPTNATIDGELVILDQSGRPQFERLMRRARMRVPETIAQAAKTQPAAIIAFDLLVVDSDDLRDDWLINRKERLRELLKNRPPLLYTDHIGDYGEKLYGLAVRLGFEGIVGKRQTSPYVAKRSPYWKKILTPAGQHAQERRLKHLER